MEAVDVLAQYEAQGYDCIGFIMVKNNEAHILWSSNSTEDERLHILKCYINKDFKGPIKLETQ